MRVLITGGAGFVGSNVATAIRRRRPKDEVVALDNLYRRGSELNLPRLEAAGVEFVNGDVRRSEDLEKVGPVDVLIECSAEPSVLSGVEGDTEYLVDTNLLGAHRCLELARRNDAQLIFLSTSRVYPVQTLIDARLTEEDSRFGFTESQDVRGLSDRGVSEDFPMAGARTLYGATKLAAELLITEYAASFGLRTAVNRCGVIAGPWQMGKVDQGVFTYWMLAHYFGWSLEYIGFGGSGKQVRDLLHVDDLVDLVLLQIDDPEFWAGSIHNVGGGLDVSLSLLETTDLCRAITGNEVPVQAASADRPGDVPVYVSDCRQLNEFCGWRPKRSAEATLRDIRDWIADNESQVLKALGPGASS